MPLTAERTTRVLLVEDDRDIARVLVLELDHAGYEPRVVTDGPAALSAVSDWDPHLVLLDLGLPTLDGIEVCRRIRASAATPIVVLTARGSVQDRVAGLDAGADDYIAKPFSLEELLARIRSTLRRARLRDEGDRLEVAGVVLDTRTRTVARDGLPVQLTPREFDLLELFLRHPGMALSRETMLSAVWGYEFLGGSNVIDSYVRYLRQKLERAGRGRLIRTVRGVGYAFRPTP
ncbi:MAG TPA: response regulator transcription factor [Solirubrobacteraceae bacterium]|nr:response regulator transcription factor [Solirubrobacteraceae bacterium]